MFTTSTSTTGALASFPIEQRHTPIQYRAADGLTGCTAYPINWDELYNLKGRLLTLVDATFTDQEQRKAHKDMVWQTLRNWMGDIERASLDPSRQDVSPE